MAELLVPYGSGIIGLMVLAIIILILGPLVAVRKAAASIKPGSEPDGTYDDPIYRLHRSHLNAVETFAGFAVPALLAMLLGVSPTWVNGLIWATVALRLVFSYIYIANIGKPAQSIRTFVFVGAWLLNVILVVLVIVAAL